MSPRTWNQAAHTAVNAILDRFPGSNGLLNDGTLLGDISDAIERMRGFFADGGNVDVAYRAESGFIASRALELWARASGLGMTELADNVAQLAARKHADYGIGNILVFGVDGLIIRTSDKVERLKNLIGKGSVGTVEPLEDAYADLVGYAIVGYLLTMGWFTLPLAEDVVEWRENPLLQVNEEFSQIIREQQGDWLDWPASTGTSMSIQAFRAKALMNEASMAAQRQLKAELGPKPEASLLDEPHTGANCATCKASANAARFRVDL